MRHPRKSTDRNQGLDTKMTPMIDVIFQLMIFFLCTTGFSVAESVLPTELPDHGAVSTVPRSPNDREIVRLEILGEGENITLRLNAQPIASPAALWERLRQVASVAPATPVVLDVAPAVGIGRVIETYDGVMTAGLSKINFAANRPSEP